MRRALTGAVVTVAALAAAGCGSASSGPAALPAARPAANSSPAPAAPSPSASPSATAAGSGVVMPPFGNGARVVANWPLPASQPQAKAVVTAENMALAILYGEYTGGRDTSWQAYSGNSQVSSYLADGFNEAQTKSSSWTGTIKLWDMSVTPGTGGSNTSTVQWCEDDAAALSTTLPDHKVVPGQSPSEQNYYLVAYEMTANGAGHWSVTQILAKQNVQQAPECQP